MQTISITKPIKIGTKPLSSRILKKFVKPNNFDWRPHQITEGIRAWNLLSTTGWVYLQHEPRTGKTGTSLYALEYHPDKLNVLIITTKNGILGADKDKLGGWVDFILSAQSKGWLLRHEYRIINHHSVNKAVEDGWKPSIVIADEAHKVFSTPSPKTPLLWKMAKMVIGTCPVMYLSATPHAQTLAQLYWQLALCVHTPFVKMGYDDFNKWFDRYGILRTVPIGNGKAVPVYKETHEEEIEEIVGGNFLTLTYKDVGGVEELEPVDKIHYIELTGVVKRIYDEYQKNEIVKLNDVIVHTMTAKDIPVRLHQIEGGTLKYRDMFAITNPDTGVRHRGVKPVEYNWQFPVHDKIAYIKANWGDTSDICIMHEYTNEGKLLRKHFKHARILQATTFAEAVDLWRYNDMIIYSMNFSTSSYIQRRDRQKHLTNRTKPITIHYLCVKGGVSEDVFNVVVENREDYTEKYYMLRREKNLTRDSVLQGVKSARVI